jgi:hypothetical protein
MRTLHTVTAVLELGAGLALLCFPAATVTLLIGGSLGSPAALTVARIGAAGLLALGVACWCARGDARSLAARGLVTALVVYNLGAVVILAAAGIWSRQVGIALWPAVILHAAMTVWCLTSLLKKSSQQTKTSTSTGARRASESRGQEFSSE